MKFQPVPCNSSKMFEVEEGFWLKAGPGSLRRIVHHAALQFIEEVAVTCEEVPGGTGAAKIGEPK